MKVNKLKTIAILAVLVLLASVLYFKARNTDTAKIAPPKLPPAHQEIKLDDDKWLKVALSSSSARLQKSVSEAPLNLLSKNVKNKASRINRLNYLVEKSKEEKNLWIECLAKEKLAEVNQTDSSYILAGNIFMEHSALNPDKDAKMYLLSKAKQVYKKAVEINPQNILANNNLAVAIIQLGQDPPMVGIGYIKKSLAIDSNDFNTNYLYAQMLVMSTQYKKAIKVYNKLVNLQPSNAGLCFTLSDIYGKIGDQAKAKEFLEKAKTLNNK